MAPVHAPVRGALKTLSRLQGASALPDYFLTKADQAHALAQRTSALPITDIDLGA